MILERDDGGDDLLIQEHGDGGHDLFIRYGHDYVNMVLHHDDDHERRKVRSY